MTPEGPLADAGAMRQFVRYARATGLTLEALLDDDLMAVATASAMVDRVPAHAMVDMLQLCATAAHRPDLGVAFAAWGNMRGYGPLSLLWDHCPTLADAMRVNNRYVHLESAALGSRAEEEGDEIALRHMLLIPARYGGSQFLEGTLTLEMRVGRMILGDEWSPLRLELDHPAPADTRYHRALFRCPIEFGADRNAMIVRRSDMNRASRNGNAHMLAYLERHLENAARAWPADLLHQVEQVVAANLANGRATLTHVAGVLAMSRRSLQRRLAEEGMTFATVLSNVRRRTAEEYFHAERRPSLTHLAHRLGYGDASAASRYLRTQMNSGARRLKGSGRS